MDFVADASCTLPWVLTDESSPWTDALLQRLYGGDKIHVPAHWPVEVSNGILMAQRRKRIPAGHALPFWNFVSSLPIEIEPALSATQATTVLLLAERHALTVYDAAYLELSQRRNLSLATLDRELIQAARRDGSPILTA